MSSEILSKKSEFQSAQKAFVFVTVEIIICQSFMRMRKNQTEEDEEISDDVTDNEEDEMKSNSATSPFGNIINLIYDLHSQEREAIVKHLLEEDNDWTEKQETAS